MFNRQIVFLLALTIFVGTLVLTYTRLDAKLMSICDNEEECLKLSTIRDKFTRPSSAPKNEASEKDKQESSQPVPTSGQQGHSQGQGPKEACAGFPDTSDVLLVMKTGASESYSKIPTQAVTSLRCINDYMIFSDMEQVVAGQHINDALNTVLPEAKVDNHDFDLYRRQKDCPVDQETCNKNQDAASAGWALDKYKNIHMAEKAWAAKPGYKWYLFIDADTYVFWTTMMAWLKTLNPNKPLYLGSVAYLGGYPFAHGGSGYLLSGALMKDMFEGKEGVANEWDQEAPKTCCGDYLLARAVENGTSQKAHHMWPTINGEKPYTLQYDKNQWCQPIATMHHLTAEEVSSVWSYELRRGFNTEPVRIKSLFHEFMQPRLRDRRSDWDNLASDLYYLNATLGEEVLAKEKNNEKIEDDVPRFDEGQVNKSKSKHWHLSIDEEVAFVSVDSCERACLTMNDCMEWKYQPGLCILDKRASLGRPKVEKDKMKQMTSGWIADRIKDWADREECGGRVKWPKL